MNLLGEVAQNINFVGKGVDTYNQLEPKYLPRGFGGVAILWSKNVDHVVKPLEDGRERIQAFGIKGKTRNTYCWYLHTCQQLVAKKISLSSVKQ